MPTAYNQHPPSNTLLSFTVTGYVFGTLDGFSLFRCLVLSLGLRLGRECPGGELVRRGRLIWRGMGYGMKMGLWIASVIIAIAL